MINYAYIIYQYDYENTPHIESPDIFIYWNMLKNLNEDVKLELISKLSTSLLTKKKKVKSENWASSFSGAWEDNRDAEDIVADSKRCKDKLKTFKV